MTNKAVLKSFFGFFHKVRCFNIETGNLEVFCSKIPWCFGLQQDDLEFSYLKFPWLKKARFLILSTFQDSSAISSAFLRGRFFCFASSPSVLSHSNEKAKETADGQQKA